MKALLGVLFLAASARAAEFPGGAAWLNVSRPLTLAELRGKVVVLDFWTAGEAVDQIGLAELATLEAASPGTVAVVGVHEGAVDAGRLRRGVLREEISHPVFADAGGKFAAAYGVSQTPALVVLDPGGDRVGSPSPTELPAMVAALLSRATNKKPLPLALERDREPVAALAAPEKVVYDPASRRLFVADTGHDRVVVADAAGRVRGVIGAGAPGFFDGPFASALLDKPRGLALFNGELLIADSGNHALRRADLKARELKTVWFWRDRIAPSDVAVADGTAFVASPTGNVLWSVAAGGGQPRAYAGDGEKAVKDGELSACEFSAPEALLADAGDLLVADSGGLGAIPLASPALRGLARQGLRRPAALAASGTKIFIADAGDGTVKVFDRSSRALTTLASGFFEPRGVAVLPDGLIVADTGADRLVKLSLDGKRRRVFPLKGLPAPKRAPPVPNSPAPVLASVSLGTVAAGPQDELRLDLRLPPAYELNPRGVFRWRVPETRGAIVFEPSRRHGVLTAPKFPMTMPFTLQEGMAQALLAVDFFYCREDGKGLCRARSVIYTITFNGSKNEARRSVALTLDAP